MDPINIIAGINLAATFLANLSGAKKGFRSTITVPREKPKTYLQSVPLIIAVITLAGFILGIFQIGTFKYISENFSLRLVGLAIYIPFSWLQIWAYKSLGENYSQDIVIFKNHHLVRKGPYKIIRHPHYTSQILMDIGAGILTLSYVVIPIAIIQIPFLILRASIEEGLLEKYFKGDFNEYKKNSGSFFPFVG